MVIDCGSLKSSDFWPLEIWRRRDLHPPSLLARQSRPCGTCAPGWKSVIRAQQPDVRGEAAMAATRLPVTRRCRCCPDHARFWKPHCTAGAPPIWDDYLRNWCANRELHPDPRFGRPPCSLFNTIDASGARPRMTAPLICIPHASIRFRLVSRPCFRGCEIRALPG